MTSVHPLLRQLQRKQLLVCAHPGTGEGAPSSVTGSDAATLLRMDTEECGRLVARLQGKGLLEPSEAEDPVLRLTPRGARVVQRMARAGAAGDGATPAASA